MEDLCVIAGATKIPEDENVSVSGKRFDIKKEKDDKKLYIQVKSGPNTMNVGMIASLNDMIKKIEGKDDKAFGILGMTYGTKSQISPQIRDKLENFENKAFIGKEFWELLSGQNNYYTELIRLIDNLSRKFSEKHATTFMKLVEVRKMELVEEWNNEYGAMGEEGLSKFLERPTGTKL